MAEIQCRVQSGIPWTCVYLFTLEFYVHLYYQYIVVQSHKVIKNSIYDPLAYYFLLVVPKFHLQNGRLFCYVAPQGL